MYTSVVPYTYLGTVQVVHDGTFVDKRPIPNTTYHLYIVC